MVEIQPFTINLQEMATEFKGNVLLEIIEGELEYLNFNRLKILALMIEPLLKLKQFDCGGCASL